MTAKPSIADLYKEVMRAAGLGLVVNLALGIVKLVGGILGSSFSLIADSVNSLGDAVSSVLVLYALRIAQQPADAEHPYGHTRAEGVAATNVALLLIVSALLVGWEAIQRIHLTHPFPPAWTLWIAGANIFIKEGIYRYNMRVGKRTGSAVILANAWDHRSDALCSLAVLIGLATIRWGGPAFMWADEVASLIVVAAIAYQGVQLFRSSASELLDLQADNELVQSIRESALKVSGVEDVETLRVRKSGLEYFVDIHIEVAAQLSVAEGHRIGHVVKDSLRAEFPQLRDVLVHLEPHLPIHD